MPNITPGDLHVNRELSTVAIAYSQEQDANFVATKIFPILPVDFQTDYFYKFGRRAFLQTQSARRAPGTETPGVEWTFTRDTYYAEVFGLHIDVEDQARSNKDDTFTLDEAGTRLITEQTMLRRELEFLNTFFVSTAWSTGGEVVTGVASAPTGTQFIQFDQAGSSPMSTFRKAILRYRLRTGLKPNFVLMGPNVWDAIVDHSEIVARVQYTQPGFLNEDIIATAIGIDNIYVARGIQSTNTDEELVADMAPTTAFLAGKSMLMGYAAPNPSRTTPSAGYCFAWQGYAGANAWGGRVKKYRMENLASDRIEIEAAYAFKVTAPELGTWFATAVS